MSTNLILVLLCSLVILSHLFEKIAAGSGCRLTHLPDAKRDFLVYEASFSDILGIIFFIFFTFFACSFGGATLLLARPR